MTHTPKRIVIHCSDTPNGKRVRVEALREQHKKRGFSDIGYHILINPDGQVDHTRPFNEVGEHVGGNNTGSIGICLVGTDKYTKAQWDALRYQLDGLLMTYSIDKTQIFCHYQFDSAIKQGKTCPNISINNLLLWYYEVVGEKAIVPNLLGG
jgi:N-acetylmuramoyl-L-alanine amidase